MSSDENQGQNRTQLTGDIYRDLPTLLGLYNAYLDAMQNFQQAGPDAREIINSAVTDTQQEYRQFKKEFLIHYDR